MQPIIEKVDLMIAQAPSHGRLNGLTLDFGSIPVDLHWSYSVTEAVELAATGRIHVAVVEDALPAAGGLEALRRMRRLEVTVPCLLVCDHADARLLAHALDLGAYSVVQAADVDGGLLVPMVLKAVRRLYRLNWEPDGRVN